MTSLAERHDALLLDLDGTVYLGHQPIEFVGEALQEASRRGARSVYVTNNASRPPAEVAAQLAGTTQNDIIKEYLSRGTYVFPPEHSLRLIADVIAYTVHEIPKWNPINICSYHLQEAGATPTQELAYALSTAIAVLDQVRDAGQVTEDDFEKVVGRISFFVNAGVRFVEEPREEAYGTVAVFLDLYGNRWDLVQPRPIGPACRT